MILLDAAASRFDELVRPYGMTCDANQLMREVIPKIRSANRALNPLQLPSELRDFWTWWHPEDFTAPAFDGFFSMDHALMKRDSMVALGYPANLIPVAAFGKGVLWMELMSDAHFGSRVYYGAFSSSNLELWTIGVSGLLDLVNNAIELGGVTTWGDGQHRLDPRILHTALELHHRDLQAPEGEWSIPVANPKSWPEHWQTYSQH